PPRRPDPRARPHRRSVLSRLARHVRRKAGRDSPAAIDAAPRRGRQSALRLQNALGILLVGLHARRHFIDLALVHQQLPVLADPDLEAIERPRRRPLEIETALVVAAAVARALEFVFGVKPARRAAKMRAFGKKRVEAFVFAHDPDAVILLEFVADLAGRVVCRKTGLERGGRLEQHARKGRAQKSQQRKNSEKAEAAPADAAEKIAPAPDTALFPLHLRFSRHTRPPAKITSFGAPAGRGARRRTAGSFCGAPGYSPASAAGRRECSWDRD